MIKQGLFSKPILTILMFSLVASLAGAQNQTLAGTRWQSIIDALETSGVRQIGDLRLSQFRKAASRLPWGTVQGRPESVYSGDRDSGYYANGKPYLSTDLPAAAMGSIAQQELHEILGALGYRDGSLALSGVLEMLAQMPDSAERRQLVKRYGQTLFKRKIMRVTEGGATGVSGGGGLGLVAVKKAVRELIMSEGRMPQDSFMQMYPKINFEYADVDEVVLKYTFTVARNGKPESEYMSVILPRAATNQVDPRLVADVARKITELFPASANAPSEPFHPRACPAGKTINFPPASDRHVRNVQEMRGAVLLGCIKTFPGETARGVTTLADPAIKAMREPMRAVFVCDLKLNGWTVDRPTFSSYAGGSGGRNMLSTTMMLNENDSLSPAIIVDGSGKILGTVIGYHPKGGSLVTSGFVPSESTTSARGQINTNSGVVDFSCQYSPRNGM